LSQKKEIKQDYTMWMELKSIWKRMSVSTFSSLPIFS
jgi:hypothetical protein